MKKERMASIVKILLAVIILAVLIFVIAYQNRDRSFGNVVNILSGGSAAEEGRSIEGYAGGTTLPYGKQALLVTTNTFMLMDDDGDGRVVDISVPSPGASVGGKYILIYDRDGRDFTLYEGQKLIYALRSEAPIIAGKVNQNGYVLVASAVLGGGTDVTVYNNKGDAVYAWSMGSGEFVDMDLSPDNSRMVISSVGAAVDELRGELSVVRIDSTQRLASGYETDEIYFNVKMNRDYTISALGSSQLALYNSDGSRRWALDYQGRTLLSADITNPDMMIICCESASSGLMGNSTQIEIVNRMGEITASTTFDGRCENLSQSSGDFAVSAGNRVYVYNERCQLKKELLSDFGVKHMALFDGGKAAFVMSGSAGNIVK